MGEIMLPFVVIIYLAFLGISIYMFVLYVKLANRGINALDIYIEKNKEIKGE